MEMNNKELGKTGRIMGEYCEYLRDTSCSRVWCVSIPCVLHIVGAE